MAENFDLIFGQNASQQYAWSDSDYQDGWETVGNIPPTAAQFDALQRRSDTKMKELNDNLTPLVNANTAETRQPATAYNEGDMKYSPLLPTWWFLSCVAAGTTSAGEIVLPSPVVENASVVDGTVTWKIRKIGSGGSEAVGVIKAFAGNGDIPSGYLLCDGSAVSRTMFPDLFAAIGTTYGSGDGSTTFNLPDYNTAQRFCQGSTVAGTVKQAGLPNIEGGVFVTSPKSVNGTDVLSIPTEMSSKYPNNALKTGSATTGRAVFTQSGTTTTAFPTGILLDASAYNPIYGNSTTVQPNALTCRYIIKAFDGQTADSALIDITQYAQELATKANRQLSNLDTANLACHVVVDSYYNSTTGDWYRVYDDGWIEQGGVFTKTVSSTEDTSTINLLKPFASDKYSIQVTGSGTSIATKTSLTTTTFVLFTRNYIGGSIVAIVTPWTCVGMGPTN